MAVAGGAATPKEKIGAVVSGAMSRSTLGTFFGIGRSEEPVRPGSQFRRTLKDTTVETASVLAVATDTLGIPHVRYKLVIERAHRRFVEETRILALKTFTDTYKEFV